MIGQKFKTIREAKGLTLREVESATTISNAYLSQLENGKIKSPSYKVVKQLSDFYGIKQSVGDMDELTMLISTMTEIEVENLTLFAKFILNGRKPAVVKAAPEPYKEDWNPDWQGDPDDPNRWNGW